jgi:hypothetical protein
MCSDVMCTGYVYNPPLTHFCSAMSYREGLMRLHISFIRAIKITSKLTLANIMAGPNIRVSPTEIINKVVF